MTHCEKCIHYDMCKAEHDSLDGTVLSFFPNNEDCNFFKNKAEFVEVVRCKDCKHGLKTTEFRTDCSTYCRVLDKIMNDIDFCSDGEGKNDFRE